MSEQVKELQPLLEEDQLDLDDYDEVVPLQPKRRFPLWAIIVSVVLVLALVAAAASYLLLNRTPAVQYIQSTVQSGNLSVKVSSSGPLAPNAQYTMNFPAAGQIAEVDVKVGDHVTAGQTLAKLTATQTTNGGGNNPPTTTTITDTLTAPADTIVATVNGLVGQNVSANGSVVSGSTSGGTGQSSSSSNSSAFMILVDVSKYMITTSVNETDINSIKVGQPAQFTISAYPATTLQAIVTSIGILGQTSSSVVTYPVQLAVDMNSVKNVNLFPGMTATVDITTAQRLNTLIMPASALTFPVTALQNGEISRADYLNALQSASSNTSSSSNASSSSTTQRVVMKLKDGKLTPVSITVGLTSGSSVEVLSGLQAGDQIVTGQTGGATSTTSTRTGAGGRNGGFGGGGGGGFGGGGFGGGGGGGGGRNGAGGLGGN